VVIGIAIQRGELSGTGVKVIDYFEDYELQNLDERKRRITLEDLLTMRSGLDWDEWAYPFEDSRNIATQMEASNDWIQFVLDRPMAHDPGEVWSYSSGASQLLSVVFKKATGFFIDEYAEEHLFRPLGITEYYWKKTPKGWPDTEGGLYLKAEDLAKIGYLILREGVWEGNQIVSTEWVEESTSPKVYDIFPQDPVWDWGYGYQWWSIDVISSEMPRIVFAPGYGGQYLLIVPELDLLAVFNSWNIYGTQPSLIDLFIQRIAPAVE
jgi:CubicO group peptidase (beta-lactamase class C family)